MDDVVDVRGGLIPEPGRTSSVDPEETSPWEQVAPRLIDKADWLRFESYMGEIFTTFGMDRNTPGTERSPERYLKALYDATAGYEGDAKLLTTFVHQSAGFERTITTGQTACCAHC
jgi:GTP cyclohydrolase I